VTAVRLDSYLARCGVASRRKAKPLIESGRVRVNGAKIQDPGHHLDPASDAVRVDGRRVRPPGRSCYYVVYKPQGYVTTTADDLGRPTVADLLPDRGRRVFPVGRLDWDSEGLVILTDDGDFAHLLQHPRHQVDKEYHVKVKGRPTAADLAHLQQGMPLEGKLARVQRVHLWRSTGLASWLVVILREGQNRQLRRMLACLGFPVLRLKRVRVGAITAQGLKPGQWRALSKDEIERAKGPRRGDGYSRA
jgi:23S rRNA pseudouridine2605 synthase